ncbi:hypothetical protein DBR32_09225 [Taibaiella sp. KBW10]|uniref:hypothetical protein n=1 Tax=Taibaiella sp. KBW10 TaxID=2153357 RepID=UPI000F5A1FF5|nr:hypothetical protein [Taibaiella sp. KBW10]RQO30885.1 hypothetical protein DBR32_09225 [Taibaiella sp. KBW10]
MKTINLFYIFLLAFCVPAKAQTVDTTTFYIPVELDEVMVLAREGGFNVANFIKVIKEDTTFYKAFKTMHLRTYDAENNIVVFNKRGAVSASLQSETKQIYRNGCRTMRVLEEKTTGDFYTKKGNYNYFTAELYANLFFTRGTVCKEDNVVKGALSREVSGNRIEKSKTQLKLLMFNPGSSIPGLPFIGNKVGIFEPEVAKMYDFKLTAQAKNGEEAYCFEALPKEAYKNKVVINRFITWFRPSDYSIIARDYSLSYDAFGYDFDVVMYVDLKQVGNTLLPSYISYKGNWKVVLKDRERVNFKATFTY